ncbi:hypothetical protein CONCODRAFT_19610 [Conidiobolus coronatus NRRL 28638]|uniref:F-box domain-containing protein n=1 Tax=Conidiobolus coronatus (strain ATCC 28846 / CBS 209.66 / NRRL 28638) TaxID=796925 RepID=A0A137NXV2_CONC2|nr:hypothetical protein CONCODRAFT_19610 [Conidiobolus coronatus NRRL 28638]|eukprot:KXN67449.1 hypothetical protein CONCODRAFT_19610 [Conidiobolus coronatus NRRL 28638]
MKQLDWDLVFILEEFQEKLRTFDLVKISLLNKVIRKKLKKTVFSSIKFGDVILQRLANTNSNEEELFKDTPDSGYNIEYLKNSVIDPFVKELDAEVDVFSPYLNSLKFDSLLGTACFLMPLAFHFNQITSLKFYDCTVDLRDFKHLMDRLTNLEVLVLYSSKMLKLLDYGPIENEIIIPPTLKYLSASRLYIDNASRYSSPHEYFYDNGILDSSEVFFVPPKHYPGLKKLHLDYDGDTTEYILEFLISNPQIACVKLPLRDLYSNGIKALYENNNINQITIDPCNFDDDLPFTASVPILKSLHSLHLTKVYNRSHSKLLDIFNAFSAIRKLEINLSDYDRFFMAQILEKLTQLKLLVIKTGIFYTLDINLAIYSNIEVLKLHINTDNETSYYLPSPPMKIKSISISSGKMYKENFNSLKEAYKNNPHWKIDLIGEVISCNALKD